MGQLGILYPRIAVAGLNPHAGEGGLLGTEEQDVIQPAIHEVQTIPFKCQNCRPHSSGYVILPSLSG